MGDKVSKEQFANSVKEELEELTGKPVVIEKALKRNGVQAYGLRKATRKETVELCTTLPADGIATAEKESPVKEMYAVVYIDGMYHLFKDGHISIREVAENVIRVWEEEEQKELNLSLEWNAEYLKEQVCYRLINFAYNRKLLKEVPYVKFLDLAMVYYISVDLGNDSMGTMLITKTHLDIFGISKEELHEHAMVNTDRILGGKVIDMYNYNCALVEKMNIMENVQEALGLQERGKMYVGSNRRLLYGAAVLAYPNIIQDLSKELGDSDLVVIGSSVHEIIILPVTEELCLQDIKKLVVEVNRNVVNWTEVLSDSVYYYDSEKQELRIV